MRLLHLGDLHLGKQLLGRNILEDQRYILGQILDLADERAADGVIIAGDIYDRSVPSEEAMNLLDWFLNELAERHISVFMVSGNHDSDDRLNFGKEFFAEKNVFIAGKYTGGVPCARMTDEYGPLNIWMLPFVKAGRVRDYHPEQNTGSYDAAVRSALSVCDLDPMERNILVAHQYVTSGGRGPESAGSETIRPENVGAVEKVDASAFDSFDYVALGHIHSPQRVGRETVRYCGSPLKYSLSEIHSVKSVPVITLREKGTEPEIELVPLIPLHEMRRLIGSLDEVRAKKDTEGAPDDYLYITLTDQEWNLDADTILSLVYPNILRLTSQSAVDREAEELDLRDAETEQKDFRSLLGEFILRVTGEEMTEEEREILLDAAKEAGVINEADKT